MQPEKIIDFDNKGHIALYDNGILIGYEPIDYVDGVRVLAKKKDYYLKIKNSALNDGVNLTIASGVRTWGEQFNTRLNNLVDKSKKNDYNFIINAPHFDEKGNPNFSPMTAKPGFSNHQDGKAIDYNVTQKDSIGKRIGMLPSYKWLVENGLKFGLIRTVPTEEWHWEDLYLNDMFHYVIRGHQSWHGLIK